jgi:hypothetical protein
MKFVSRVLLALLLIGGIQQSRADGFTVGGSLGLSLFDGSAGFHIAPMGEYPLNKNMAIGTEFSINTTPLIWFTYFKYHFLLTGSKVRPYADAGLALDFQTGGPYFGIHFGGGADIPLAPKLFLAPELQMGPIFSVGGGTYSTFFGSFTVPGVTIFAVYIRGSIHYEI